MRPQPHSVAARLGLDETTIRRLRARGHLPRLALTEPEIRERLYHAHLAHALAHAAGNLGGEGTVVSLPRCACALARRALAWTSLAPPVASAARTRSRWWRRRWPRPLGSRTLRPRRAGRSSAARTAVLGLVLGVVLLAAPTASAYERPPLLENVASYFAMRPAEVRCPSNREWVGDPIWGTAPNPQRGWGYTDMMAEYIVLHPALCAGAVAVSDPLVPLWQRATGVLVLVHEAYHLRRWKWRRNEAKVECQAIRHFRSGAQLLGASPELANELLPFALAAHARMVTLFPEYRDPRCKLPLWTLPMTP